MALHAAYPVSIFHEVSAEAGSCAAAGVKLIPLTVPRSTPQMVFQVRPTVAMTAGLTLGAPYCLSAGTVVMPVVNPTAGDITQAGITYRVVAI